MTCSCDYDGVRLCDSLPADECARKMLVPKSSDGFTVGRYVVADTDAVGARDPIMLTQQVKFMRDGMAQALGGRGPGLILLVVDDDERDAAVKRVVAALMADEPPSSTCGACGGTRERRDRYPDGTDSNMVFPCPACSTEVRDV